VWSSSLCLSGRIGFAMFVCCSFTGDVCSREAAGKGCA